MRDEISILKARGLSEKPESSKPAPPGAAAARQRYTTTLEQFNQLVARINTYRGQITGPEVNIAILRLVDEAIGLAGEIRNRAVDLDDYPTCFIELESGVVYYRDISATAVEAYRRRISELESIELDLGRIKDTGRNPLYPLIDLSAHALKGGHLLTRHVGRSMNDLKERFLEAEERGSPKRVLSSFVDERTAQEAVSRAVELAKKQLQRAQEGQKLYISINELNDIGYAQERGKMPRFTKSGRLVVVKDSSHPDGFRIITALLGDE